MAELCDDDGRHTTTSLRKSFVGAIDHFILLANWSYIIRTALRNIRSIVEAVRAVLAFKKKVDGRYVVTSEFDDEVQIQRRISSPGPPYSPPTISYYILDSLWCLLAGYGPEIEERAPKSKIDACQHNTSHTTYPSTASCPSKQVDFGGVYERALAIV